MLLSHSRLYFFLNSKRDFLRFFELLQTLSQKLAGTCAMVVEVTGKARTAQLVVLST